MPSLVRDYGFELPVFAESNDVILKDEQARAKLRSIESSRSNKFVRQMRILALGANSLRELLSTTDTIFGRVAEKCGARVVEHVWGLYETPFYENRYAKNPSGHEQLLPDRHILAAQLAIIRSATVPCDRQALELDYQCYRDIDRVNGFYWGDAGSSQFVNGIGPDDTSENLWLVDIEPVLHS